MLKNIDEYQVEGEEDGDNNDNNDDTEIGDQPWNDKIDESK